MECVARKIVRDAVQIVPEQRVTQMCHMHAQLMRASRVRCKAQLDLMNPQNQLYASVGSTVSNPNEMKSTVSAFLISFITAVAVFFLLFEGAGHVYIKLICVSLGVVVYRTWMFFSMLKLYYKEK